jgi:hypothetical protein
MAKKLTKKTAAKTRKTAKKKPMQFADGKDHSTTYQPKDERVAEIKRLEKAIGLPRSNPFRTEDEAEFDENVAEMNLTDMQALAVRAGVFPSGTRPVLRNKLKKAFYAAKIGTMSSPLRHAVDPDSDAAKAIRKISKA